MGTICFAVKFIEPSHPPTIPLEDRGKQRVLELMNKSNKLGGAILPGRAGGRGEGGRGEHKK